MFAIIYVAVYKNWRPQAVFSNQSEALEREAIVERSIDLSNNDPHAAGIIDNFAATVIGSGLVPDPSVDRDALPGLSKEEARRIQGQMRAVYNRWAPYADAGLRMHDGQIQYLEKISLMRYGEFFKLLPMIKDPHRPYMLACQLIHPMRAVTVILADLPQGEVAKSALLMLFGALVASYKDTIGYFFGTSKSSAEKTRLIAKIKGEIK